MSLDEVHPINGSISLGDAGSYSSSHSFVRPWPDCIAFFEGLKMRAVMMFPYRVKRVLFVALVADWLDVMNIRFVANLLHCLSDCSAACGARCCPR